MLIMLTQPASLGSGKTRSWSSPQVMQAAGYGRLTPLGVRRLDLPITHRDRAARFAAKQASPPREEHR